MSRFCFALCVLLATASPAMAEEALFRGTIGDSIAFLLSLDRDDDPETGTVWYDSSGEDGMQVRGARKPDGQFEWEELLVPEKSDQARQTGIYRGRFDVGGRRAEGSWTSADGHKSFPLTLQRVATYRTVNSHEVDAEVQYPQFDDGRYALLNRKLDEEANRELERLVASIREQQQELKDMPANVRDHLAASSNCDIDGFYFELVSLSCQLYEYSGGAHGNTVITGRNFELAKDGKPRELGLWDILDKSPKVIDSLSESLIAALRRQGASSITEGEISDFKDELASNELSFTVLPAGLAFYFAPYSVGAYAEGSFRVVLASRELTGLFRPDSPLAERAKRPAKTTSRRGHGR